MIKKIKKLSCTFHEQKFKEKITAKLYLFLIYFFVFFTYLYSKIFVNFSIKKYSKSKPTKRQKIVLN